MVRWLDSTNRRAIYMQNACYPYDRFIDEEDKLAYTELTGKYGVKSLYGKIECDTDKISYKVFADPECQMEINVQAVERINNGQWGGWSSLPISFDYKWGFCQPASADGNYYGMAAGAIHTAAAFTVGSLVVSATLF